MIINATLQPMKKMSGQEAGEANVAAFDGWVRRQSDADYRAIARAGKLNRSEIVKACGFARSVLQQNPVIAAKLMRLEDDLRVRGVLSPHALLERGSTGVDEAESFQARGQAAGALSARLKSLESQVDVLRAENTELKRRLKQYEVLEGVLGRMGRLPR